MSATPAPASIADLRVSVADLRDDMSYRLGAMLNAARLLAAHQRVHASIVGGARIDAEFSRRLSEHCTAWGDPSASDEDDETLPELLRVACWELNELVNRAGAIGEPWAKGDAA